MNNPKDRSSLVNKQALKSLRDEMALREDLERPSWTSVHSHYYFDLDAQVWRELDVVSIRWWKARLNGHEVIIKVAIIVESKHLGQKHVLLPAFKPLRQAIIFDWLGGMAHAEKRLQILLDAGVERRLAQQLDNQISAGAADVMPDAPHILYPPKARVWHSAGFVEALPKEKGKEDPLSKSVIWRARLGLQSAAKALAHDEIEQSSREVQIAIRLALVSQMGARAGGKTFDLKDKFLSHLRKNPFTLTVFHPIVVVDSDLWGVTQEELRPVKHARIHLTGVSRFPYFWFDLVQRDIASEVMALTQAEYDRQAEERGLEPFSPRLGVADYEIARP